MQFLATLMPLLAIANAKPTLQRRAASCGLVGYDKNSPNAYYFAANTDLIACATLCASQTGCNSIATGEGNCLLYTSAVADNFAANAGSTYIFNDLSCVPLASSGKQAATSTAAAGAQTCAPTTVTISANPVTITAVGSASTVKTTVSVSAAPVTVPNAVTVSNPVTVTANPVTVTAAGSASTVKTTVTVSGSPVTITNTATVTKSATVTVTATACFNFLGVLSSC